MLKNCKTFLFQILENIRVIIAVAGSARTNIKYVGAVSGSKLIIRKQLLQQAKLKDLKAL